ncbi:unnamed protein product [Cochlearia groenlandica]
MVESSMGSGVLGVASSVGGGCGSTTLCSGDKLSTRINVSVLKKEQGRIAAVRPLPRSPGGCGKMSLCSLTTFCRTDMSNTL